MYKRQAGDGASNMIWVFPSMNAGGKLGDPSELTVNVTGTHKIFGWTDHRDDFLYVAGGAQKFGFTLFFWHLLS